MLLEFSFKNFKSYREETCLDLSAARLQSKKFHVKTIGGECVLPCAVIFGANAGGKSNVYDAFDTMRYYVLNSFAFGGNDSQQSVRKRQRESFLFADEASKEPTKFEVFFIEPETGETEVKTWQYGFSYDDSHILEEWLFLRKGEKSTKFTTVFVRENDEIEGDAFSPSALDLIKKTLNSDTLVLSLGEKLKFPECKNVVDFFRSFRMANYGRPHEALLRSESFPFFFATDSAAQEEVAKYLSTFDKSITGFRIEEEILDGTTSFKTLTAVTTHQRDPQKTLLFANESSGTQKMLSLYPDLKFALKQGGGLFIDELGARLHPLLHLNIIASFLSPITNKNGAQLIITSHDVSLLAFDYLRDDEIWIAEKSPEEESKLYSFSEFKDAAKVKGKQGRSLLRNYLLGKLGGIPILDPIEF